MANLNDPTSAKARGARVRTIRKVLLRFSREAFTHKHHLSAGTLQGWEDGHTKGLSEKGARKLLQAFAAEGVHCTLEWLMYGIGAGPLAAEAPELLNPPEESEAAIIAQELKLFHQLNPGMVDTIVTDECMLPCFAPGDHVAGKRFFSNDISAAVGLPCIVQTLTGNILVRIVKPGTLEGHYLLKTINTQYQLQDSDLVEIKLFSAAPIVWVRRKISTLISGWQAPQALPKNILEIS